MKTYYANSASGNVGLRVTVPDYVSPPEDWVTTEQGYLDAWAQVSLDIEDPPFPWSLVFLSFFSGIALALFTAYCIM